MEHYICRGGCQGVSARPGTCGADDCPMHGELLESCDCEDSDHYGAFREKETIDPTDEEE